MDESALQTILQASMDGFWLADAEGRLLEVNQTYEAMSGYGRSELLAMRIQDLEATESETEVADHAARIRAAGQDRFTARHRRRDGTILEVESSVKFLPEDGGRFLVFLHDISSQERTARELQENLHFFEQSQKAALIGSYKTDFSTGVWASSAVHDAILGIGPGYDRTLAGWLSLVHPDDRDEMEQTFHRDVAAATEKFAIEYRIVRASDGAVRWVYGSGAFGFDADGHTVSLIGTIQDITDKKAVELALLEQTQLLTTVMSATPDLVWFKDAQGVFRACNRKLEELFGRPRSQIIGKTDYQLWDKEKADLHESENRSVMSAGVTHRTEEVFVFASDGHTETVETVKTPVHGPKGEVLGLVGIARDISERKRAEAALSEQKLLLRTLVDAQPDLLWLKDARGVFLLCNRQFCDFYSTSEDSMVGKTDYDLVGKAEADAFLEGDRAALEAVRPVNIGETAVSVAGQMRILDTTKVPVFAADGSVFGVIGIGRDISDLRAAERDREKLLAELRQAQKLESLGTLAGGIAHDMNNVLAAILTLASVGISTNPPGSDNFRAFNTIAKASTRGGNMLKNVLSLARQAPTQSLEVDLNALVRQEAALLEASVQGQIKVRLALDQSEPAVRGDAHALGAALMNLCVNGRHAMPDGGVLTLSTRRRDQLVELQVTDTGVGMTPEVLEKCLDPFFTTKPVGQGTGLGLSMVYATVRAHGGHLDMTSQPGLGTTVTMTFSASTPISAPAAREEARSVTAEDLRLHVLVVDDDELVQLALRDSISALGHRLTITDSGEQAVALLRDGLRPDVVLLDLNMPGWGGVGTLSRLREDHPDLPVILSTGRLDQSALDLKAGKKAVTLLAKPYTVNELKEKLRLSVGRTE